MVAKKASAKKSVRKVAETQSVYRPWEYTLPPNTTRTEHPHIVMTPGYIGGKPRIAGTRIAVWLVAAAHRDGWSIADMLENWPHVTQAQLHDALSYYHDHREEIDRQIYDNSEEGSRKRLEA